MNDGVEFLQATEDRLHIRRRPRLRNALFPAGAIVVWLAVVAVLDPFTIPGLIALGVGFGACAWWLPAVAFAVRVADVTLARSGPLMLLGTDPLEAARVETRVHSAWLREKPRGYSVSLWVLLSDGGSRDVELGRFRTLLDASQVAGTVEQFLALAPLKSRPSNVR